MEFRRDASMLNVSSRWGPSAGGRVGGGGHRTAPQLGPPQEAWPHLELGACRGRLLLHLHCPGLARPGGGGPGATPSGPSALGLGRMSCPTSTRG